ncbi:MAG: glycosyltransferase family 39 protein [Anaerolineales bacterium]|nr:glycosyltransferase family 39 protein [Anaerolineales bacterium]
MAKNLLLSKKLATSLSARLALIVGLSGLIYLLVFTLPFPLSSFYATIPPVDYTKLTGYSWSGFIAYVAGLGVLFGLYIWAVRLAAPEEARRRGAEEQRSGGAREQERKKDEEHYVPIWLVFVSGLALAVILIFSYPVTAIDLFIYAIRSRGWALYGFNPLTTPPQALPAADPWLGLAAEWRDAPSPYGPLWEWLSLGAFHLSGGDFLSHLLVLKMVAVLAYLGSAWLVYRILQQFQPQWAIAGTISFAWSPLVLLESAQNGHNDIVMVFFLLAAVWVLEEAKTRRREEAKGHLKASAQPPIASFLSPSRLYSLLLVCLFLGLSILVKFVTLLLAPFFLLAITAATKSWAKRLALMMGYGLTVAVLVVLPMLPLWPGRNNWAVLQAGSGAGRSLLALLVLAFKDAWGINFAFDTSRSLLFLIYGLIYLYFLWQMVRSEKSVTSSQKSVVSSQISTVSDQWFGSREPTFQSSSLPTFLTPSFHVLFWYVLLVAPVFHAWYLLWFLPLAALMLPQQRPLIVATVFSITALFIIPYFETIRVWYPVLLASPFLGHLIGVPLLLVPPALALLWPISPSAKSEV